MTQASTSRQQHGSSIHPWRWDTGSTDSWNSKEDSFCHEGALTHPLLFLSCLDVCFHESCFIRPGGDGRHSDNKGLGGKSCGRAPHNSAFPFLLPFYSAREQALLGHNHKLREFRLMAHREAGFRILGLPLYSFLTYLFSGSLCSFLSSER